jgi:hypothetical protein
VLQAMPCRPETVSSSYPVFICKQAFLREGQKKASPLQKRCCSSNDTHPFAQPVTAVCSRDRPQPEGRAPLRRPQLRLGCRSGAVPRRPLELCAVVPLELRIEVAAGRIKGAPRRRAPEALNRGRRGRRGREGDWPAAPGRAPIVDSASRSEPAQVETEDGGEVQAPSLESKGRRRRGAPPAPLVRRQRGAPAESWGGERRSRESRRTSPRWGGRRPANLGRTVADDVRGEVGGWRRRAPTLLRLAPTTPFSLGDATAVRPLPRARICAGGAGGRADLRLCLRRQWPRFLALFVRRSVSGAATPPRRRARRTGNTAARRGESRASTQAETVPDTPDSDLIIKLKEVLWE